MGLHIRSPETFLTRHGAVIRVELTRVRGSSPRGVGTEMFVSRDRLWGTVGGGQPALQHQHHVPLRINAATARAAAHLRVLGRVQEPLLDAIEFGCAGEDYGASWEVETHRDGLRRNEQAQQPLREQDLDQLAQ